MSWLNRVERKLEPYAIPNLSRFIAIGQAFILLSSLLRLIDPLKCFLVPGLVQQGEWWRLFTFLFIPPPMAGALGPIFVVFTLYLIYMYGSALERTWGTFRFNLYVLIGYVLTVAASFVTPWDAAENAFLYISFFLAFAYLNPDLELLVFFIIPVRIKWLAAIGWGFLVFQFWFGSLADRLSVGATIAAFLLFFASDLTRRLSRSGKSFDAAIPKFRDRPVEPPHRHKCVVCGRTEVSNPELDFRYCSKCAGDLCYCSDHLHTHQHVIAPNIPPQP